MSRLTVITASLVAAFAAAFGTYRLGQASAAQGPAQLRSVVRANNEEPPDGYAKLAMAIGQLERRLAALELKELSAKPAEPLASNAPPIALAPQLDLEAMRERQLERASTIEAALRTEARDRPWANATESQLQSAVDAAVKEGAQFSIKTLRCLTSLCEMVLAAPAKDQLVNTAFQLGHRISGMSSYDVAQPRTNADGSATVTYRLFRQGYSQPGEDT